MTAPAESGSRDVEPDELLEFEPAKTPEANLLGVQAARGVSVLVGRTLGLQILTAGVTIVLARLLTPADYGLFAIALAIQLVGQRAAELGLPAALVRHEREPSRELQASVFGVMLATSAGATALFLIIAFVALPATSSASKALEVVAIAMLVMPLYASRAVPVAMMERQMHFGRVAIVETAETLMFNAFAFVAALAGLGAFSLAGAVPMGGLAGLVAAMLLQATPRRPTLDLDRIRPMIGFGARVTVLQAVYLLKELGFVLLLTAVGSASVAGFYSMAKRLFSFPIAVASAVSRVSFPALSRDSAQRPERAARIATITAIATGLPLALVAGAAQPLIGLLIGDRWLPTADIVQIGSIGMLLTAAALASMNSYELAEGSVDKPITAAISETLSLFLIAALLLNSLDELAVGIALAVSAAVSTAMLAAGTHPHLRRAMVSVLKSTAIATAAAGGGQLLQLDTTVAGLAIALSTVAVIWLVLEVIFSRRELIGILMLVRPLLRRGKTVA